MNYHIEIPIETIHDRSKYSAGNGSKIGRSSGHNKEGKSNRQGIYYMRGMGCSKWNNCFEGCPFHDCRFQNDRKDNDLKYLTNRGENIKVW